MMIDLFLPCLRLESITTLTHIGKTCEIINTVKLSKLEYFEHIMKHAELSHLIIEGRKIKGKPGRRRKSWLENLKE